MSAGLADTSGDTTERRRLFELFSKEIEAHAAAEEIVFYAELMSHDEGQEQARHSVAEHKTAADLLDELSDHDMSSGAWLTIFRKLKEKLEHHIDEEEEDVFGLARSVISDDRATALGEEFHRLKAEKMTA